MTELGFELLGRRVDTNKNGAWGVVRGIDALEIGGSHSHRRQRHGQLRERQRLERAARDIEQLERLRDVGNGFGADRVVGDEQRRELGDLRQALADPRGIRIGTTGCDACRTQGPSGVLRHPRQGLGKLECF